MPTQTTTYDIEWWGFSREHGWVVLDRNIVTNRPGKPGNLVFLRCKDWTHYDEERKRWEPPHYVFSERYLESLDKSALSAVTNELQELREQFKVKKYEFYSAVVKTRHEQFLSENGLIGRETRRPGRKHRASVCWNCKQSVDNAIDLECSGCGWIICGSCGACGCKNSGKVHQNSAPEQDEAHSMILDKPKAEKNRIFASFAEASIYAKENPGAKITRANNGKDWKAE